MNTKRTPSMNRYLLWMLISALMIVGVSCGLVSAKKPAGNTQPLPGLWAAQITYQNNSGKDVNWAINFELDESGKKISNAVLMRYLGEYNADTMATVLFGLGETDVKHNAFSIPFSELDGFTMRNYTCKGTFTSSNEASGTLLVGDDEYAWAAVHRAK